MMDGSAHQPPTRQSQFLMHVIQGQEQEHRIAIPSSHYSKLFAAEDEFKGPEKTDAREEAGLKIEIPRWPGTWSRVQVFRI